MRRVHVLLDRLDEIAHACSRGDYTLPERAAIYAAVEAAAREVRRFIDESANGDGYAHEKLGHVFWHIGAAVGFDNGHSAQQHAVWAMGEMSSLRAQLRSALNN